MWPQWPTRLPLDCPRIVFFGKTTISRTTCSIRLRCRPICPTSWAAPHCNRYTTRLTLAWLLEQIGRKTRHGNVRSRAVFDSKRQPIGWYIYYLNAGGVSEVVQIAALDGSFDQVLRRLLADAWRHGAAAVRGRLEPRFVQQLSDRHCWLRREGSWTLVHSRHADVTAAIQQGDAFLSRLEGEWWMRFVGEGETRSQG